MRFISAIALAAMCVAALACSSDSTVIATLPPPQTKLSELDADQREQLCTTVQARGRAAHGDAKLKHAICLLGSSFAAALGGASDPVAACQQSYDECIAGELEPADPDAGAGGSSCSART